MSIIKFALPSKGRIQEDMNDFFSSAGIKIDKLGGQRTYIGGFKNFSDIEIRFLSANEIAKELHNGNILDLHQGVRAIKEKKLEFIHLGSVKDDPT